MLNIFSFKTKKHKRNKSYQVWTHENHAIYLYSPDFIREKIEYVHQNPVRAGIVEKPEDSLYSSARNYATMETLMDIPVLSLPWHTY